MSSSTYERLIAAGAPRLPDGYFYRVRVGHTPLGDPEVRVHVRRHRTYWSRAESRTIRRRVDVADGTYTETDLVRGVAIAASDAWDSISAAASFEARERAILQTLDSLAGDHP